MLCFKNHLFSTNARPGITPNKSVASRSPSLVKDAKVPSIPVQSAGQLQAYQYGENRVNLPQYTNDLYEDRFIHPENTNIYRNAFNFDYNDNNFLDPLNGDDLVENEQKEKLCHLRLNRLISFFEQFNS